MTELLFMTVMTALLTLLFLGVVAEAVCLIQRRLKRLEEVIAITHGAEPAEEAAPQ